MLHLITLIAVPSFDLSYPQIFFIPLIQGKNPVIKAHALLLQIGSALCVSGVKVRFYLYSKEL